MAEPQSAPIFVVGPSRSGTTLVRRILNANSAVSIAPETHYFDDLRPRLGDRAQAPLGDADAALVERYFLALGDSVYGHEGDPSRSALEADVLRATAQSFGGTADAYFEAFCRLRMTGLGRSRWGEKTPRHVFRISEILAGWPDARVLCLVRDPRAVVASYRDWKRGKPDSKSADRARVTRSYHPVVNAMLVNGAMEATRQALERHGPDRVMIVRYEELVNEPEAAVRRVTEWLGLEYEQGMLEVPEMFSSYGDVGRGISKAPVERWRKKLSPTEVSIVQTCCRRAMDRLGYAREPVSPPLLALALAWASFPVAVGRATLANRKRLGNATEYLLKRVRLGFSRGG